MTLLGKETTSPVQDGALLVARLLLGSVLIAHGWVKINEWGIEGTAAGFDGMGVPLPTAAAVFAAGVEFVGGIMVIAGLLMPVVSVFVVGNMLGAAWFAHRTVQPLADQGGWELVGMIAAAAAVLGACGAGKFSLDHLLGRFVNRNKESGATEDDRFVDNEDLLAGRV